MDEQREQMIRRQEEFNQRVEKQERQRLQELWPTLSPEERQRREEEQQRKEEQRRQTVQRQREFWQRTKEREQERDKEQQQRMEELRRKAAERQKAIRKVAGEYSDEVWQEALGATPEQWKEIKPRLEKIHRLKDSPYVDVSIYWIAGSTSYQAESLVESPDGAYSMAKASGWFSVTAGVGTTSESSSGSSGSGRFGTLPSAQYSATTRTAAVPKDPNRPDISMEAHRVGSGRGQAVASGTIKFDMRIPGPIKKKVDDIALGWQWERPSLDKSPDALSESEEACERLAETFEMGNPDPAQLHQRIEALRHVRQQRRAELEEARRQLLALVTPAQEVKLISMGYLE
ncbi:MAG: hypothetical protein M1376_04855 [Planctomycetes bacterium]|nr:hypothetical protein [Planctomycetota bacterium]